MKSIWLVFMVLVAVLLVSFAQAAQHQVRLKMWKNNPHVSLKSLNIYYNSRLQKFIYLYHLTDGTNGSIQSDDIEFSRQSALYAYRAYFSFFVPTYTPSMFYVYIYPSSAIGDVSSNIAKNAASQATGNNVLKCLNDLREKKNRRVQFYQTSTRSTIDCRYY